MGQSLDWSLNMDLKICASSIFINLVKVAFTHSKPKTDINKKCPE